MLDLKDFQMQDRDLPEIKLEDFVPDAPEEGDTLLGSTPRNSAEQLGANYAALGAPHEAMVNFTNLTSDFSEQGDSRVANQLEVDAKNNRLSQARKILVKVMSDPDVPIEQKAKLQREYAELEMDMAKPRNMLSLQAADSREEGNPNSEEELAMFDTIGIINRANEYKRKETAALNREAIAMTPHSLETAADFFETFIPLFEGSTFAGVLDAMRGGDKSAYFKAITMLGSSRAELRDLWKTMDTAQRSEMLEKLITIVRENDTIIFPDKNDFNALMNLRAITQQGYYTDVDKWIDNVGGLVDLLFLGAGGLRAGATGLLKGGKAVKKARELKQMEENFKLFQFDRLAFPTSHVYDTPLKTYEPSYPAGASYPRAFMPEKGPAGLYTAKEKQALQDVSPPLIEPTEGPRAGTIKDRPMIEYPHGVVFEVITPEQQASMARRRAVQDPPTPTSLSQNLKDVNPKAAKQAHELAAVDETGQGARAVYGTSRTSAIANDLLPEVGQNTGVVRNKIHFADEIDANRRMGDPLTLDMVDNNGAIYFSDAEKKKALAKVVTDFRDILGTYVRNEMTSIERYPDAVGIRMMLGPKGSGFHNPNTALETIMFQLKDYGITPKDLTLYKNEGGNYIPVNPKMNVADLPNGDYLVSLNHKYRIAPGDVDKMEKAPVKHNFLDRFTLPGAGARRQGSLARVVLDAHSMLAPIITHSANVAVDKAAGLEKALVDLTKTFGKGYSKLKSSRREIIDNFIFKANDQGLSYTWANMKAAGLKDAEMVLLHSWKRVWDTLYWLENRDWVKTLRNQGYKIFVDKQFDSHLIVKPVPNHLRNQVKEAYDPTRDMVVTLTRDITRELDQKGGFIAALKQYVKKDGIEEPITHVIVHNTSSSNYVRRIRDDETILNYRPGYYTVYYKQPHFIVRVERDTKGNIIGSRAIATAGDQKTAKLMAKRISETTGQEHVWRKDLKNRDVNSNDMWDIAVAHGRTQQKFRGKRLEEKVGSTNLDPRHTNIADPIESLSRSIRSVARRTHMRDYLDTTKERFMQQFGDLVTRTDEFGRKVFPENTNQLDELSGAQTGHIADARTTWEYINSLEFGYVNSIDDTYKAIMSVFADVAGAKGIPWLEKGFNNLHGLRGPSAWGKSAAFKLYLALHPFRQQLIQGHQMIQLVPMFPQYIARGGLFGDMLGLHLALREAPIPQIIRKLAGRTEEEFAQIAAEYRHSGLGAAVDANNLVRKDLVEIADYTYAQKAKRLAGSPLRLGQTFGFDIGEGVNISSAWLAFRHKHEKIAREAGRKLDQADLDKAAGEARNFTYNMNQAGEMPYNQNTFALFGQFLQVPHKAFTQMVFNQGLTKTERAKLIAWNTVMYGVPSYLTADYFGDLLPEDQTAREFVLYGLETVALNWSLSLLTGQDTEIDWSDLAPNNTTGVMEFVRNILTSPLGESVANLPSTSLIGGHNPRLTNFVRDVARWVVPGNYDNPVDFGNVAYSFAQLSSGFSDAFKALYALEYGKKINAYNDVLDPDVSKTEAILGFLGLKTQTETERRKINQEMYYDSQAFQDDVRYFYREQKRLLKMFRDEPDQAREAAKSIAEAWRVFPNDKAQKIIDRLIIADSKRGDISIVQHLIDMAGWEDLDKVRNKTKRAGLDPETEKKLLEFFDFTEAHPYTLPEAK